MRDSLDIVLLLRETHYNSRTNTYITSNNTELTPETYNSLVNFMIDELIINLYDNQIEKRKKMITERQRHAQH